MAGPTTLVHEDRAMQRIPIALDVPTRRREADFLAASRRSRKLHAGLVRPPATAIEYRNYVERCKGPLHEGRLVTSRETNALLGVVNINEIVRGSFQSAYLGYYVFSPHQGNGYMRGALAETLKWAFGALSLHRVEANIQPHNTRSIELVRGLDFRMEGLSPGYLKVGGRWRDHERWALRADEWRKSRKGAVQ